MASDRGKRGKFRVGQVVRLREDYVSSFGWTLKGGTLCIIDGRGTTWDCRASFKVNTEIEPLQIWLTDEQLRPLTARERGPQPAKKGRK